jgi:hypothetical protein
MYGVSEGLTVAPTMDDITPLPGDFDELQSSTRQFLDLGFPTTVFSIFGRKFANDEVDQETSRLVIQWRIELAGVGIPTGEELTVLTVEYFN